MSAQFHICRGRGVAVVLASGAVIPVISLTAVTGGIGPALAAPVTTTVGPTTVTPVPICCAALKMSMRASLSVRTNTGSWCAC